jgi:hypothetical protein
MQKRTAQTAMSSTNDRSVASDDGYGDFERRNRRIRLTAWITIVALIVGGGGASLATLFFG